MTTFKTGGYRNGFNTSGTNKCVPNEAGPPKTKFGGRPAVPKGGFKRYPGGVANISDGNRRLAKTKHGDGGGSGTRFSTTGGNAFGRGGRK